MKSIYEIRGEERGEERGEAIGEIRGMRNMALFALQTRFGQLPAIIEERVNAMESEAEFEALAANIVHAASLDDFQWNDEN